MTAPVECLTFRDYERRIALTMRQAFISEMTQLGGAPVPSALLVCRTSLDLSKCLPVANNGLRRAAESVLREAAS